MPQTPVFERLLGKGWLPADRAQHPLGGLQGRSLGPYRLAVLLGPQNRFGATYFQVFLQMSGETSPQPVLAGLHSQGRYPAYNWIEISLFSPPEAFGPWQEQQDISADPLAREMFRALGDLIPPGGHLMVEYDSQRDTAYLLARDVPPAATPLGFVMTLAGCGTSFRDWYFAEGGSEGSRKLQGFKALDQDHARSRASQTIAELLAFLDRPNSPPQEAAARDRARLLLARLDA
ncbi:MAG: DUF1122 family protein [Chloroflexi bacterium]|nr:DUF1122 family protein [Chloroflexota bacterium]